MITSIVTLLTFGLYPVIFLYFYNISKLDIYQLLQVLLPLMIVSASLTFYISKKTRSLERATCLASIFTFLFFSYGYIASFLPKNLFFNTLLGPINKHTFFIPIWLICTLQIIKEVSKAKKINPLSRALNYFGIALIASNIVFVSINLPKITRPETETTQQVTQSIDNLPDIYHIVLDGHAREDILQEFYGFDNSDFTKQLEDMGFYVVKQSRSNYSQTYLSMASTFNLNYLDNLGAIDKEQKSTDPLSNLLKNAQAIKVLKKIGYKIVNTETEWSGAQDLNSDVSGKVKLKGGEFEMEILGLTPIAHFGEDLRYNLHRKNIIRVFNTLPDIATDKEPTFTYTHVLAPHPPFVFDEKGNPVRQVTDYVLSDSTWKLNGNRTREEYKKMYVNQLRYTDSLVLKTLKTILERSEKKPIIILQSDHGPASIFAASNPTPDGIRERTSNLLAYYLPTDKDAHLYQTMTPINTYRMIFNTFFETNYPLLEDKSFISPFGSPYELREVSNQ